MIKIGKQWIALAQDSSALCHYHLSLKKIGHTSRWVNIIGNYLFNRCWNITEPINIVEQLIDSIKICRS